MSESSLEPYQYEDLPTETSFRVVELLPGQKSDPIFCLLHIVQWTDLQSYEAVSYAWGDPKVKTPIVCDGREVEVSPNLHSALIHFRFEDRSRFLWADALCINQANIPERGLQVKQMQKIYRSATEVLLWIGPDSQESPQAAAAMESITKVSDFLCHKLDISLSNPISLGSTYQEYVIKRRDMLPLPDECEFSTSALWESLKWFYSHRYFSRIWVIQEISANQKRSIRCGYEKTEWDRVDLVASYIIMDTSFANRFGFSNTYCWWVASVTELVQLPRKWLSMLYLASNFSCLDARDVIYSMRGLMRLSKGTELLNPDYSKSVMEVYRDSVEAAFINFSSTDALLYIAGNEDPSWVPRWDRPMLFRNPFRFGKPVPWKPAGDTEPDWKMNKNSNVLSLCGTIADTIALAEPYNETIFSDSSMKSEVVRSDLHRIWQRILQAVETTQSQLPLKVEVLTAAATSFSFGLDENTNPAEPDRLFQNFVAYLRLVLDKETYAKYIPSDVAEEVDKGDGHVFGKPVWDFTYPQSTFFVTKEGSLGCCVSVIRPEDVLYIALGSTYPLVLRPDGDRYRLRGYAYIHGMMHGEHQFTTTQNLSIY